jgi:nicotinamide mononucleotide transporter
MMRWAGYTLGLVASAVLVIGSLSHKLPMDPTEVLGFVTGGWAVWLTVKQNIWNWPIGIANSAFYLIVFFQTRLYADMSLQGVYVVLGFLGWYWWLRGGQNRTELNVSRTRPLLAAALGVILLSGTWAMTLFLVRVDDSAPFLDALTTVLSLIAQFMLTRKLFENWFVWISADVIYIGLYIYKDLYLTSILYAIFLAMCIVGAVQWRRSLRSPRFVVEAARAS